MFMLPDLKPEEVLIYLRKSRTDDPALTVSEVVAKHEQMLDDYSMRVWGALIPERNRFREIVSGETIFARPEIQKVLRLVEQPCFRAILIVEPQRLSRGDLEDIGRLSKLLRYTGTIVITLQYSYDLTDERDRDYFERELKRGNEFLEYSKRIMMNGRNLAAEKGYYTGSRKPFGYTRVFRKEGNHKYPTLAIVPDEAAIVRTIFRMYAEGNGATNICSYLNSIGSKPERGDLWSPPAIYHMLDNPLYNGKIKWGYRKTVKKVEDGEIKLHNPKNKDCPVYEGKHEAIIGDGIEEQNDDPVLVPEKHAHGGFEGNGFLFLLGRRAVLTLGFTGEGGLVAVAPADQEQKQDGRRNNDTVLDPRVLCTAQQVRDRDGGDGNEHACAVVADRAKDAHAAAFAVGLGSDNHNCGKGCGDHSVDHGCEQQVRDQCVSDLNAVGRAGGDHEQQSHDSRCGNRQHDHPAEILLVAAARMVDDVAEDHIGKRVEDLGERHDHTDGADRHADLVGIEILQLSDEVRHQAQGQLAAHICEIVPRSHRESDAFGVELFLYLCHVCILPVHCL